ncbi:MAG TPA: glycerol-3-phosphate dehydrogenase/oxidase [Candidatus Eisenbacteria bacterium]|nr:glycerol-3-phosphate dehydrogenase/oxidase [Candidatus Eisenbacteria bacterium]
MSREGLAIDDILVIGGGIHGVAVARDATLRGLRVVLVEANDLASGTSSRTSKLVHGGIRYLETGQFGLVREALRERSILLRTASAFVGPVSFLIPHYKGSGRPRAWVDFGIALYSLLARDAPPELRAHGAASSSEALSLEPGLDPSRLTGASRFADAQMEDARLCVALARDAASEGLEVLAHTAVVGLAEDGGGWRALLRRGLDGADREVRARFVVNAAGPWSEDVDRLGGPSGVLVRRTRGTHVVVPAVTHGHALLLTSRRDGRVFFVLPWGQHSLIGTTDVDDDRPPEEVSPPAEDIRYLLEEAARALPGLRGVRPVRAFAGVRSLVRSGAMKPWANAREHRIVQGRARITLIGGKYTTHRSLAERVVDRIVEALGARTRPCTTTTRIVPLEQVAHTHRFILPGGLSIAEPTVKYAVSHSFALRLDDVLLRRTRLWLDGRALRAAIEPTARWMAPLLGWSTERTSDEINRMTAMLDQESNAIEEAMR